MGDNVDYYSSDDDDRVGDSGIKAVQRLGNAPQQQLSALRRLLGIRGLLHHIEEDANTKSKHRYKFISTCHSCLGDAFNSLPGIKDKSDDEIYALEVREVWSAVVQYLDKVSTRSPGKLRMLLHTQCRENFRSMRQFTEKVFSISKQLRSVGKVIDDDELKGVLYCGIDPDLFAIQIDKWTSADEDKYTSAQIANELIILEKEYGERSGDTASISAAKSLLARKGYTVNAKAAAPAPVSALIPSPAPAPAPEASHPSGPLCTYCSKPNHTAAVCRSRRRDLQAQIQAIDALTITPNARGTPAPTKPSHTADAQGPSTGLLAAVTDEPAVPPPLPAEMSSKADEYFKKNVVPSKAWW